MNEKTAEFEPISPESLDDNRMSPVKRTTESRENQEARDEVADGSYLEGKAKSLDFSTGEDQQNLLLDANLSQKFVLYFDVI